ncbi:MAG: type IV pilus assembly protein PilM [Thermodesulfobacteriota bacterium]
MAETIGLDIGSHSIKLVGLKMASKGGFLTYLGVKEISPDVKRDDVAYFAGAIKELLKEAGLKPGKVNLTVSGSGVYIRRIALPFMPRGELKEAVRWGIKEHLPFPVETAQVDFHILGERIEDKVKKLDLMAVACPNVLINQTLAMAKNAGLHPAHLGVGSFALWDAFLAWGGVKEGEEVAVIDLGADRTGIHFFKGEDFQFSREVTPAGADITRSIIEGMGSMEGSQGLYERAERIKALLGSSSEGSQEKVGDESVDFQKIIFYVRPILERLAAEIGRSLDYYRHEFNVDRIDRVLVTGGGSHSKNFVSYLQSRLRLPVEHFNPLKGMLFDPKKVGVQALDQMGSQFTIAAGVALSQPKRIEFLPGKEPLMTRAQIVRSIPVLTPLITLLAFSLIIWIKTGQMAAVKREWDAKVAKVANIQTLQTKLTLLKEKEKKVKEELSLFPSSVLISVPHVEILREISRMIPDNVTLTHLSALPKGKKPNPPRGESPPDRGWELRITGIAFGSDAHCLTALAQMIERLEKSQLFRNTKLLSADETKLYNRSSAEFEILSDIVVDGQEKNP